MVGLPGVGKSSLFLSLTGVDPAAGGGPGAGAFKAHVGIAQIPDPRLAVIAEFVPTRKIIPATIQFVDIPGVAPGSPGSTAEKGKVNAFLANVREVDAICHVVRCFEVAGLPAPNPARDVDAMDTELILADLQVVESARDRAARTARAGAPGDADAKARLLVIDEAIAMLSDGKPIRARGDWTPAQRGIIKNYGLITAKPVLYVANVDENDLAGGSAAAKDVERIAAAAGGQSVCVCAKLEGELAQLEPADRTEMLESLGLTEPAIGPLARAVYRLLGLESFYTAGEKEVRAWTVAIGATAPEAAGAIHSDIQRGFIRAECYSVDDLVQFKSEKAVKEAGKLRSEGKAYRMKDGDVVHFLFNV